MSCELVDDTVPGDVARMIAAGVERPMIAVDSGATSKRGAQRRHNEDVWADHGGRCFVVVDGMGGRPGGELAADVAARTVIDRVGRTETAVDWRDVIGHANSEVRRAADAAGHSRVGAAMAAVYIGEQGVTIAHVGDVRVYRLRDGITERLTSDHNIARELRASGVDPHSTTVAAGRLGALTCYLGDERAWEGLEFRMLDVRVDDVLLVCTDGVHQHMTPAGWDHLAADGLSCRAIARAAVEGAVAAGAGDDATAVTVRIGTSA